MSSNSVNARLSHVSQSAQPSGRRARATHYDRPFADHASLEGVGEANPAQVRRRARTRRVLGTGAQVLAGVFGGPVGSLVGRAAGGAGGSGERIDSMWARQSDAESFNEEYLELQQQMQADNRQFSAISNVMKARHDTARAAISNMRV